MTGAPVEPRFPGGMASAPETTPGGCANPGCSCPVARGQTHCCRACARQEAAAASCRCGHFGCAARVY